MSTATRIVVGTVLVSTVLSLGLMVTILLGPV